MMQCTFTSRDSFKKYCTRVNLLDSIANPENEVSNHILTSVFKPHLFWIEDAYDQEAIYDALRSLQLRDAATEFVWIYVLEGDITFHGITYLPDDSIKFLFGGHQSEFLKINPSGTYITLNYQQIKLIQAIFESRERERRIRFIRKTVFNLSFIQERNLRAFCNQMSVHRYGMNQDCFVNDGNQQYAVIYSGLVSVEFKWRRQIEISQLSKGFSLMSHSQQALVTQLRYKSKSDNTVLLVFRKQLIDQEIYCAGFKEEVFQKYSGYLQKLRHFMEEKTYRSLHRLRASLTKEIRKKQEKEELKRHLTIDLEQGWFKPSKIVRQFSRVELGTKLSEEKRETRQTKDEKPKRRLNYKNRPHHSTIKVKSFSTLATLTTHRSTIETVQKVKNNTQFFVPEQFVSKKLRMEFDGLLKNMRKMSFTVEEKREGETLRNKMKNVEDYINEHRIVKTRRKVQRKYMSRQGPIK